ncbi:hypothetical protein FNV43_RR24827 [Rhamnella rubrinervis]|uniref:Phorbol-ester/DAG-type domain-containing protein n=1 Tax=Rhamnella rubrinervis TaxID=2594499 RepID=A0A8K0DT16_9ROSA|nr:hypothetical protein FNV43_RR24827 [Rhamnella rubrinervis]
MEKGNHFSHPDHRLELKTFQKPYRCDGCKEPGFGKRYRCDLCDFDLHQDCMFFTQETSHHFFQNSTFKFFDQPPTPRKSCGRNECDECKRYCDACGKPVTGFVYHCEEDDLDFHPCCLNLESKLKINGTKFRLWRDSVAINNECLDLENLEIPRSRSLEKLRKNGGRGNKYWKMMKVFFKTIACILLGDPTIAVTCLVLDLVT